MRMSRARGWCDMHHHRWRLWGDPKCATRKAAALALAAVLVVGCASLGDRQPAVVCTAPEGMVLVPNEFVEKFYRESDDLADRLSACSRDYRYWASRNDCS